MAFTFQTNLPYPNRIQWILNNYSGALYQNGPLGSFDPRRDLEVYVDGVLIPVRTFSFDAQTNRYLLFMESNINLQGVIQVVHRMPSPPFMTAQPTYNGYGTNFGLNFGGLPFPPGYGTAFGQSFGNSAKGLGNLFGSYFGGVQSSSSSVALGTQAVVPSFSLMATYSTAGDATSSPIAAFTAVPLTASSGSSLTLLWNTVNITQIEITADNGVDAPFDSGLINTQGSGTYVVPSGVTTTTTFTLNAYDSYGHLVLSPTTTVLIPSSP